MLLCDSMQAKRHQSSPVANYKIVVTGRPGVGKTAWIRKMLGLPVSNRQTIGCELYKAKIVFTDNTVAFVTFWDLGGTDFGGLSLGEGYFTNCDTVVMVKRQMGVDPSPSILHNRDLLNERGYQVLEVTTRMNMEMPYAVLEDFFGGKKILCVTQE